MLTNLIFLVLEDNTNNDRTPPYIDTYLLTISKLWKSWKKRSPIRMNLRSGYVVRVGLPLGGDEKSTDVAYRHRNRRSSICVARLQYQNQCKDVSMAFLGR